MDTSKVLMLAERGFNKNEIALLLASENETVTNSTQVNQSSEGEGENKNTRINFQSTSNESGGEVQGISSSNGSTFKPPRTEGEDNLLAALAKHINTLNTKMDDVIKKVQTQNMLNNTMSNTNSESAEDILNSFLMGDKSLDN